MTMMREEYDMLTGQVRHNRDALVIFENIVEEGWMDHMGIITQKGQRAIEEYEQGSR